MAEYLDKSGVALLWEKVKNYVGVISGGNATNWNDFQFVFSDSIKNEVEITDNSKPVFVNNEVSITCKPGTFIVVKNSTYCNVKINGYTVSCYSDDSNDIDGPAYTTIYVADDSHLITQKIHYSTTDYTLTCRDFEIITIS